MLKKIMFILSVFGLIVLIGCGAKSPVEPVDTLDNLPELQTTLNKATDRSAKTSRGDKTDSDIPDALLKKIYQTKKMVTRIIKAVKDDGRPDLVKAVRDLGPMIKRVNRAVNAGEWRSVYSGCDAIQQRCRRIGGALNRS